MTASPRYYRTLDAWGTSDNPPMAFRVFAIGANEATKWGGQKETVYLTASWAQAIAEEWARRGIDGAFDFEHGVIGEGREGVPAAGWFKVEARNDGLWALVLRWSDRTLEYFARKEYRYFSPYFDVVRAKDGRLFVSALLNIALTNWPATDNQRPLIALSQRASRRYKMDPQAALKQAQMIVEKYGIDAARVSELALDLQMAAEGSAPTDPDAPAPEPAPEGDAPMPEAAQPPVAQNQAQAVALSAMQERVKALESKLAQKARQEFEQDVETCITQGRFLPAQRQELLSLTPEAWAAAKRYSPAPKVSMEALTPQTRTTQAPTVTVEQLEADPKLIAFCRQWSKDPKEFARDWAAKFPNKPFMSA